MPYINIKITRENGSPTNEQKEQLIAGVTQLFEQVMGRSGKNAVVIIDEIEPSSYGIGGQSITNKRKQENTRE